MEEDYYSKKGGCDLKAIVITIVLAAVLSIILSILD